MGYGGGGKGDRRDRRPEDPTTRTKELDDTYNTRPAGTSTNATCFALCMVLVMKEIIRPVEDELQNVYQFIQFSKYFSYFLRQMIDLIHRPSLGFTLHEFLSMRQFVAHTQKCFSFMKSDNRNIFGDTTSAEVFENVEMRT